jgi:hypothetical protein
VITRVCFLPSAPALVPEVGRGLDAELADARAAIASVAGDRKPPGAIALLGPGPGAAAYGPGDRGSFAGFGVDLDVSLSGLGGTSLLPPALAVGAYFVPSADRAYAVGPDGACPPVEVDELSTLVVLGDGSARRTEKAPGYLDERAAGYDETVRAALASGDPAQLADLDVQLGSELLAAGAPVWRAVAPLLERTYRADVRYAADPFGVEYFVALWQ